VKVFVSTGVGDVVDGRRRGYMTQIAQYRQDFRRYLQGLDWADEGRNAVYSAYGMAHDARVLPRLHEDSWNRYGWPESAGGLGGNEIHRAVYYEELSHAMLPVPAQHWTLETLGPALLKFAPGLAAQYLPGDLDGSEWWGQCFSEPDSGSDLATLRTRAITGGDGNFVVNGQKIWTSQGPTATRLLVRVRNGAPETRRRGLTMIMVYADAPGVTVLPIALASGRRELAEALFDDVAVPRERGIGEIDGGWAVEMHLMQYERGIYGYAVLTELARLRKDMVAGGPSPAQRERFGRVFVDVVSAQARTATTVRKLADGTTIGADSSIDKLLLSRVVVQSRRKRAQRLILDVLREQMIAGTGRSGAEADTARAEWWYSRAASIMGGTARCSGASSPTTCSACPEKGATGDRRFVVDGRTGGLPSVRRARRQAGDRPPRDDRAAAGAARLVGHRGRIPDRGVRIAVPRAGALSGSDGLAESGDAGRTGGPSSAGGPARRETIRELFPGKRVTCDRRL